MNKAQELLSEISEKKMTIKSVGSFNLSQSFASEVKSKLKTSFEAAWDHIPDNIKGFKFETVDLPEDVVINGDRGIWVGKAMVTKFMIKN